MTEQVNKSDWIPIMPNSSIFRWKTLLMTLKVWNYGFTLILIWMMLSFAMMLWNFGIHFSLVLSASICIAVFLVDWLRCYRKLSTGIEKLKK